ncbi:hypothetical protein BDFB_011535 [Asbolus verrucosus]|uniref:Uncharacterized protein n=1 Tax=Asbolus verrucosus TaxID=1661398 RepID=A0A482VBC4_ASBVE|nr:hypothetical protein BDFB_011535 [Asbolus verrucosus]
MDKFGRNNRANQKNPNNPAYHGGTVSHGYNSRKCYRDNRANQLNPNNPAYWSSRAGSGQGRESSCTIL